ncbi:MAG: alpha/beta fold hydrolase [Rhodobacter sp.]|nr:alpha/beta fold hydrolase [Rhodobacter sp.]
MWRFFRFVLAAIVILAVFLAIPFVFNDYTRRPLSGPSLDQLSFEEVRFQNGDLDLTGMLMLPAGEGPFPGAVFIHGSGTSRRDNPWYLSVAEALLDNGIAVLIPDKRGSENSGGDWRDTSFEELATDTDAAFDVLIEVPQVDSGRVGLIGFSQGGSIVPIVAAKDPSAAFVVSMVGSGVTTEEQLIFEEINNITQMGTYRFVARLVARFTVPAIMRRDTWRATAGFDPMTYWRDVEAPVFAAFGEGDTNVPVAESIARFETLPYEVLIGVYPDGGHGITDPVSGHVQQAFLDDLVSFVLSATEN